MAAAASRVLARQVNDSMSGHDKPFVAMPMLPLPFDALEAFVQLVLPRKGYALLRVTAPALAALSRIGLPA